MVGTFITFEGPEGAGKSTQVGLLADWLHARGKKVLSTREPGGTSGAEAVRATLINPDYQWSSLAELLLMNAARDAHLQEVILPALEKESIVLCDRFCDSTRAYQGSDPTIDESFLMAIEKAVCTRLPDLTLVFDLPVEVGLGRADQRGQRDRFEQKGIEYHRTVRERFRDLVRVEPRAVLITADGSIEDTHQLVLSAVKNRFPELVS